MNEQTYEEYLETMKAYHFYPLERELWEEWKLQYNKRFIPIRIRNNGN
jgi:hypothetical protein